MFNNLSYCLIPIKLVALKSVKRRACVRCFSVNVVQRSKIKKIVDSSKDEIINKEIMVHGWVRSLRNQKNVTFININDGSTMAGLQAVYDIEDESVGDSTDKNKGNQSINKALEKITIGSSVSIQGLIVKSMGKGQEFDLQIKELELIGECPIDSYPIQRKHKPTPEYLRTIAHLRARTNTGGAVARIRSAVSYATHLYFQNEGFQYVHTPIITASDCEGAGEMFRVTTLPIENKAMMPTTANSTGLSENRVQAVEDQSHITDFQSDFFQKEAFLTVSGQLSGETYATALSDIYTFGPTFRAEKSDTSRHLAEFYMVEPEMSFCNMDEAMENAENYIKYVLRHTYDHCKEDLEFFNKFYDKQLFNRIMKYIEIQPDTGNTTPFVRLSYHEAVVLLQEEIKKNPKKWQYPDIQLGDDLHSEHEKWLADTKFKGACVFLYNYPRKIKSFYMRDGAIVDGLQVVSAFDLIAPKIGELVGGSQREERLDVLESKMKEFQLDINSYQWYLDLRRFGSVPHSGYGVGFERLICLVTGLENVRDVIPYPRYLGKADF